MLFEAATALGKGVSKTLAPIQCLQANESVCVATEALLQGAEVSVLVYNPTGWTVAAQPITTPVPMDHVAVYDGSRSIDSVVSKAMQVPTVEGQAYTLTFRDNQPIPPLGFRLYSLKEAKQQKLRLAPLKFGSENTITLDNGHVVVNVSLATGGIFSVWDRSLPKPVTVNQTFLGYTPLNHGDNASHDCSSAYSFRPDGPASLLSTSTAKVLSSVKSSMFSEVLLEVDIANHVTHRVRLYTGSRGIESVITVGPVDTLNAKGLEIVSRFDTTLDTNGSFFTDSNGGELQERWINHHPTYPIEIYEPIASNFYPLTAIAMVKDSAAAVTLVVDRSQCAALSNPIHLKLCNIADSSTTAMTTRDTK